MKLEIVVKRQYSEFIVSKVVFYPHCIVVHGAMNCCWLGWGRSWKCSFYDGKSWRHEEAKVVEYYIQWCNNANVQWNIMYYLDRNFTQKQANKSTSIVAGLLKAHVALRIQCKPIVESRRILQAILYQICAHDTYKNSEVEDQAKWLAGEQWSRKCALIYMQRLVITRAISRQPVPRRRLIWENDIDSMKAVCNGDLSRRFPNEIRK